MSVQTGFVVGTLGSAAVNELTATRYVLSVHRHPEATRRASGMR